MIPNDHQINMVCQKTDAKKQPIKSEFSGDIDDGGPQVVWPFDPSWYYI